MMNAMLNVEFQVLQKVAQQRPEKSEPGDSQFRDMLEERQNAGQATETTVQEPKTKEQTVPMQETVESMDDPQMQEQMVIAAMAMLQNPVVYVQPDMQNEQQQTEVPVEMLVTAAVEESATAVETVVVVPKAAQRVQGQMREQVTAAEAKLEAKPEAELRAEQSQTKAEMQAMSKSEAPVKVVERTVGELQTEAGRGERKSDEPMSVGLETETPVFQDVREIPVKVGEASAMQETVETQPVEKQVGDKLVEVLDRGENHVEIQLTPENLGRIEVDLTWSENGALRVTIQTENSQTRSLLERETSSLLLALSRHTGEDVQVLVTTQSQESQQQNFQQDGRNGEQREPQQQRRQQEEHQNSQDFLQQLRLGLIPLDLAAS